MTSTTRAVSDGRGPLSWRAAVLLLCGAALLLSGCTAGGPSAPGATTPEHEGRYGIYRMDRATSTVELLYSSEHSIHRIHENATGTKLVFRQDFGSDVFTDSEICLMNTNGSGYEQLTNNVWLDAYPCWSPDGSKILFLSWPDRPANTMDIFVMDGNGTNRVEFYDSGHHDGDCSWTGSLIVFTRESQIWVMEDDGTNVEQVTDYVLAGQQGNADLPFGDYDPRIDPTETLICFDRMVDDQNQSGNYDFYTIGPLDLVPTAITDTGWQQFIAEWSHAGDLLLFTVAAKGGDGLFDLYTMSRTGTGVMSITPSHWPEDFLCSHGIFSHDDSSIYFVGEWWESDPGPSGRDAVDVCR